KWATPIVRGTRSGFTDGRTILGLRSSNPAEALVSLTAVLDSVREDIGYAVRASLRHRTFTLAVLLTLALGIGANSAMFSIVDAVLLRPLPYPSADRLVLVARRTPNGGLRESA